MSQSQPKTIRRLEADEIDCRVAQATEKGVSILLYKDARVDQRILDETFGPMNWQRSHQTIEGRLYCTISVWDADKSAWVSKQDVGTESNTEAEKGLASDSFKRACFNWGIGRELYTAPFIWISGNPADLKFEKYRVDAIGYDDNRNINYLVISNAKTKQVVYSFGKNAPKAVETKVEPKPEPVKFDTMKAVKDFCDKKGIDGSMFTTMRNACIEAGLLPRIAYGNMTEAECKAMIKCVEANMGEDK